MAFQLLRAGAIFIIFAVLWGVVIKLKVNRNRGKLLYCKFDLKVVAFLLSLIDLCFGV